TASAVASAPTALVEAARAIGAGRGQVVTSVVLPSARPSPARFPRQSYVNTSPAPAPTTGDGSRAE
ncbi:ABC transporter permease subunit, partial [Streptomyces rhizosphaericola]|uniref:ABC transporter permease subunit n=1 Tax=Streptomyces rhizosphaericola TaxID=2564098 RepID=UPI0039EE0F60